MTTTDTDALTERIVTAMVTEDHDLGMEDYALLAARVLPIVAEEARKAKAEALREAAEELFYDGDYDVEARGYHQLHARADRIETGDSDEHR